MQSEIFGKCPDKKIVDRMIWYCEQHAKKLRAEGCEVVVAIDRVFDCFNIAINRRGTKCIFNDDQALLDVLNNIVEMSIRDEVS